MNFVKFSVNDTNVFPMANSTAGGQLLNEFNLRCRESVGTSQEIKYMVGPSYTHSQSDFTVSFQTDSVGTIINRQNIQISEGRAIINGHFIESLTPVVIDLVAANAQIQSDNRGLPSDNKKSLLKGNLAIGLRMMYSTEMTTSGSLLVEDDSGMYLGIQVVILPEDEFITPIDEPEDPNLFTAHLLLGKFKFINNVITNITQNPNKVQMISADRIGDVGGVFDGTYVTKTGLDPKHHYVFTTKHESDNRDTWCEADDALMIWDKVPQTSTEVLPSDEAHFEYNSSTRKTNLVVPHKQIDGPAMSNINGEPEYFLDKVISLPTASYPAGTGGVVDKAYTDNVKQVVNKLQRLYMLPNGHMRQYIDTLEDRSNLPNLKNQPNWGPGDYIVVGQDNTAVDDINTTNPPSTIYMIIPGRVNEVYWEAVIDKIPEAFGDDSEWNAMIVSILSSIDWRKTIHDTIANTDAGNLFSIDWNAAIREKIAGLSFLQNTNWGDVINDAIDQYRYEIEQGNFSDWQHVITDAWSHAYDEYIEARTNGINTAKARVDALQAELDEKESLYQEARSNTAAAEARQSAYTTASNEYNTAAADLAAIKQGRSFTKSTDYDPSHGEDQGNVVVYTDYTDCSGRTIEGLVVYRKENNTPKWYKVSDSTSIYTLLTTNNGNPITDTNYNNLKSLYDGYLSSANTNYQTAKNERDSNQSIFAARTAENTAKTNRDNVQGRLDTATAEYRNMLESMDVANEVFQNGSYYPTEDLAQAIATSIDIEGIDWTKFIVDRLAKGIADTSEIEWSDIIASHITENEDLTNIPWNTIIPDAILNYIKYNNVVDDYLDNYVPASLKDGIELGRVTADELYKVDLSAVNELLGITLDGVLQESRPRGRVGTDYFRVIYTNQEGRVYHTFFAVGKTEDKEYCDPPMRITSDIPYAQEDTVGGFLNVPESQLGAGYVYRNEYGYLQLLDYELLASGVLAYQLGEDFTCPSGLSSSEIQANLDEYVNTRVAFPNANQLTKTSDDPYVIHVYINLSQEDDPYEISLNNIDSRFGTIVYLHVSGESSSSCILNIIKCQKLRLDLNVLGGITVNLVDTELYYDPGVLDQIEFISGLTLWYKRFSAEDANILVQDMSVEYMGTPTIIQTQDYWTMDSPNDNHYSYGLKGITFDNTGHIVGAKLLVTDDITSNVQMGTFISTFEFEFPQGVGLAYPATKLSKSIKITGQFITAYPDENGYLMKDNEFTAMTYKQPATLKGLISFKTEVSYVESVYGINGTENHVPGTIYPSIDTWENNKFHIFEGGIVD